MSKRIYPVTVENGELVESSEKLTVNGLPIAKDGTIDSSYVSGSGSSEWEVDANGDLVPVDGEPVSVGSLRSDELLGIADRIFKGGNSVTDINSALTTAGNTVILAGDHSSLSDRIEIGAPNVTLLIAEGATVSFDSTASPTTITDSGGSNYHPLIYNNGYDEVTVINRGTINPNNSSFKLAVGVFYDTVTGGAVIGEGGDIVDCVDGVWTVDSTNVSVRNIYSSDHNGAVVVGEGCVGCTWRNIIGAGSTDTTQQGEVADMNGINQSCELDTIVGTGEVAEVLDMNGNRDLEVSDVIGHNKPTTLLSIAGTSSVHFSGKTAFGNQNNITVNGAKGTTTGHAIAGANSNPIQNLTITGIDVTSTTSNAVRLTANTTGQYDGLRLEGRAETTGTGTDGGRAWWIGEPEACSGAHLDIEGVAADADGAVIVNFSDVSGTLKVHDSAGSRAVGLIALSGYTVENHDLDVQVYDNSGDGVGIGGAGTISNVRLDGSSTSNTGSDITMGGSDHRIDIDYGTRTTGGTRTVWNGLGYNSGDPSAGGDWNGYGYEGLIIRDTTNANTYIYNNGGWSQIASA